MAIRGVYSDAEKKMLATYEEEAKTVIGWVKSPEKRVATEESMKRMGKIMDYWNPLWHDEQYAMNTRWGGLIAPPFYQQRFAMVQFDLRATPEVGIGDHVWMGEDWEFFQPVRPGDTFKAWSRHPQLEETTSLDGQGPRQFRLLASDVDIFNQRDELVSNEKRIQHMVYHAEPPTRSREPMPEYVYNQEELDFIYRTTDEEEIRGDNIRFWEDVNVGDETRPVVLGPSTILDVIGIYAMHMENMMPIRDMRKKAPGALLIDPVTNVYHHGIESHLLDRAAQYTGQNKSMMLGRTRAAHYAVQGRNMMVRLVTNWMGDDGFIRKFKWRYLAATYIGDTLIGRGKVVNKHLENGEHLVDLAVWAENITGNIGGAVSATVRLMSKEF
jgi:acyl dehydratase